MKLTMAERESLALIDYIEAFSVEPSTSVIAEIEVVRNLRKASLDADEALTGFYLVGLDNEIRRSAIGLGFGILRSLDAIHVATALSIPDRELQFVTYDDRQAEAARRAGLTVVQPGR